MTATRRAQTNFTGRPTRRVGAAWSTIPEQHERVAPVVDPEAVPEGTAREVLTWVGSDEVRAAKALEAEQASSDPRKVLAATLTKLAQPKPVVSPPVQPVLPVVTS